MSESINLVFLGTSSGCPTKDRNPSSLAVKLFGHEFMIDCSEGSQQRLMQSGFSYMKIERIFLTHLHGDHFFGLPGLIATMAMHKRDYPLYIYGPKGLQEMLEKILALWQQEPPFEIKALEARQGIVWEEKKFKVSCVRLKHSVPCLGYVVEEKLPSGKFNKKKALALGIPEGPLFSRLQDGESVKVDGKTIKPEMVLEPLDRKARKISYIMDTVPVKSCFEAIENSDLVIHEAEFTEDLIERARQTMHSTARQAGWVASQTNAIKLVLTHLSARYKDEGRLENEARQEFNNVVVAKDLMELEI
ncbi:ribonuclease Z [archaeon]|nr:ribonuclease Z [archaeon]